jgi:hypothetical protein
MVCSRVNLTFTCVQNHTITGYPTSAITSGSKTAMEIPELETTLNVGF